MELIELLRVALYVAAVLLGAFIAYQGVQLFAALLIWLLAKVLPKEKH